MPRCLPICAERRMPLRARGRVRVGVAARARAGASRSTARAGAVRLDVAAAGARALARLAVLDDHHVAELGPAAVEPAAGDDAAADAGAERQQDEVARRPARAERGARRSAAALASLSTPTGRPSHSRISSRKSRSCNGMLTRAERGAGALVDARRNAEPDRRDVGVLELAHHLHERVEQRLPATRAASGARAVAFDAARPRRRARPRILVPPRSTPMTRVPAKVVGTLLLRMAPDEKPYRVYRGGRVKGKVPVAPARAPGKPRRARARDRDGRRSAAANGGRRGAGAPSQAAGGCAVRWRRVIALGILVLFALVVVWAVDGLPRGPRAA